MTVKKNIVILGSTGSIGTNALWVARNLASEITVSGLAAGKRSNELARQACEFGVTHAVIADKSRLADLAEKTPQTCKAASGPQALIDLVTQPEVDMVLCAIDGISGLKPVLAAIEAGKDIALASKEILVSAGSLVMGLAKKHGVRILPVDSEHSAIFQCLQACRLSDVSRLILTASGGPFRDKSMAEINGATYSQALSHPTWDMGPKITIDSATMMNKALELIEARWLFNLPPEKIEVIIHPQSIIHSAVEMIDSGLLAQMGVPDMRLPIQYALTYPERRPAALPRCHLQELGALTFQALDNERFPSVKLAREALRKGGTAPAVLNAANEVAVNLFSRNRIKFPEIWRLTQRVLDCHIPLSAENLEVIIAADKAAREKAEEFALCYCK